jgi:hypothetical protein
MRRYLWRGMPVILVVVLSMAGTGIADGPYGPEFRYCGSFKAAYRIHVYATQMRCRKARRIQKEYWLAPRHRKIYVNGGVGATGYVLLKRFPGWRCSSGSGGGNCAKGDKIAAYQN